MHSVWYGLWVDGIIRRYVFKYDPGNNVTVNCARNQSIILNFVLLKMQEIGRVYMWFQ